MKRARITIEQAACQVFNRPVLISEAFGGQLASVVMRRLQGVRLDGAERAMANAAGRLAYAGRGDPAAEAAVAQSREGEDGPPIPYSIVDGVAVLGVTGVLTKQTVCLDQSTGEMSCGYEDIEASADEAFADARAKGVMLIIDSPGGAVDGNFDLCQSLARMSAETGKPLIVFINGCGCSGAYSIASQASPGMLFTSDSSMVGSIGVYCILADETAYWTAQGIKVEMIRSARFKGAGSPLKALTDDERAQIQGEINGLADKFVALVARGRRMSAEAVRATEARVYLGDEAVRLGLADRAMHFQDALAAAIAATKQGSDDMGLFTRRRVENPAGTTTAAAPAAPPAAGASPGVNPGATLAELSAAFPGDEHAAFVLDCLRNNATLAEAKDSFIENTADREKALREALAAANRDIAAARAAALKTAGVSVEEPGRGGGAGAPAIPIAAGQFPGASGRDPGADWDGSTALQGAVKRVFGEKAGRSFFVGWATLESAEGVPYLTALANLVASPGVVNQDAVRSRRSAH